MTPETDGSVSVVVRRRIHPELQADFEIWLSSIIDAASAFEGHLGAQVLRPADPAEQDYVLLFRFATPAQHEAWRTSSAAREWLEKGKAFTRGDAHIQTMTGLEFWFRVPGNAGRRPPPRSKMVVATVIGLYPLILFVAPVLAVAFRDLPRPLAVLLSTLCMVILMTYAVMPLVTRTLSRWLF
ncbi:MAG: antibiotic biosynthesis monooxygenase [Myxococcota bacterium]